jgi:RNA polymerase sigma factor (sigma-70 family)
MSDRELLQEYARTGSPAAFERLVKAHVDLVYSSARRRLGDAHLAEDVTQVVFLMLCRKAGKLPEKVSVTGWLFKATQYAAADALKMARRRERHERQAAEMAQALKQPDDRWQRLSPYLDEALAKLGDRERDAVLLRYFRGMSLEETGKSLGVSGDAVAQRVSRGLQKLRAYFARKGIVLPAATLATALATNSVEAAPAGLGAAVVNSAGAGSGAGAAAAALEAADRALKLMGATKVKTFVAASIGALAVAGTVGAVAPRYFLPAQATQTVVAAPAADVVTAAELRAGWGQQWNGIAIMAGWPLALPGAVTGTPTPADIDGDGDLELLVPGAHTPNFHNRPPPVHPRPSVERLLFAFHHDGTPVSGWPAVIADRATREKAIQAGDANEAWWSSSPSVMDWDGDGRDEVVILDRAGTVAIEHEGKGPNAAPLVVRLAGNGDGIGSAPLADLNGDRVPDLVMGHVHTTVNRTPVRGWPESRRLLGGFAPAVADANKDGTPEVYHPFYVNPGTVGGFDNTGRPLGNWPQKVNYQCRFPPVLGDVDGDGMLEVVAAHGGMISVWRWDGTPLAGTKSVGPFRGVFKENVFAMEAAPTVADLDGDGAGEVIVFDMRRRTLLAWRADGSGFTSADGVVAELSDADCWGGVTVADLGGDGTMDLFVCSHWVQLPKNGPVTVTRMLPESVKTTTQCTITDLDRDGSADVAFGVSDGRVFVYRTGKSYRPEWMHWPTQSGNFRHTGVAPALLGP